MLRALAVLATVSGCSAAIPAARGDARSPAPNDARAENATAETDAVAPASRLAPPFGRSAGVRRVLEASEPAPTVVAAAERHD